MKSNALTTTPPCPQITYHKWSNKQPLSNKCLLSNKRPLELAFSIISLSNEHFLFNWCPFSIECYFLNSFLSWSFQTVLELLPLHPILATFRMDYEYNIEYKYDFWILNQWCFQSPHSFVLFTSKEGNSRNKIYWHVMWQCKATNWNWKLVLDLVLKSKVPY